MSTPLDGVWAKLDRARLHARNLNDRLADALDPDRQSFIRQLDGHPSKYVYKIERVPPMETEWSLILGDFLTNVRAALDHLAWQLVILDGAIPDKNTKFPICLSATSQTGRPSPARIAKITSQKIIDAVESVQPYKLAGQPGQPANPESAVLHVLNRLVNADKHRLLLTSAVGLRTGGMWWGSTDEHPSPECRLNLHPLEDGHPVAWFDFGNAKPDPNFDPHLGLEVRLKRVPELTAPIVYQSRVESLVAIIYDEVEHGVIGSVFAPLFGLAPRHWAHSLAPPTPPPWH